ncbi:MAG: hypothetical protein WDN26_11975 [Chitinophagaceae bacterium]
MKNLFLIIIAVAFSASAFCQSRFTQPKSREERLNEEYCTGIFKTPDATYFDLIDDGINNSVMGYSNILDWLNGRVAGLQVYKFRGNVSIPYIRNQRAAVYIDEIPVSAEFTSLISIPDIAMIKIIKGPFIGGSSWYGNVGAILIYTMRGEDEEESED